MTREALCKRVKIDFIALLSFSFFKNLFEKLSKPNFQLFKKFF